MASEKQELYDRLHIVRDTRISAESGLPFSVVIPYAMYSPWYDDAKFMAALGAIDGHSLIDIYRAWELWSLVGQVAASGGDILEVGVWRGGSGCLMAARAKQLGFATKVALCDPFAGVAKAGSRDPSYKGGEHADTSPEIVQALATRMGADNIELHRGIFPDDTAAGLAHRRFALVHIDVDVYESARQTFEWAWPRLLPGGAVVFDDYGFMKTGGITQIANEVAKGPDRRMLHNLNGHAVILKLA
jgi:O-methyltransferase